MSRVKIVHDTINRDKVIDEIVNQVVVEKEGKKPFLRKYSIMKFEKVVHGIFKLFPQMNRSEIISKIIQAIGKRSMKTNRIIVKAGYIKSGNFREISDLTVFECFEKYLRFLLIETIVFGVESKDYDKIIDQVKGHLKEEWFIMILIADEITFDQKSENIFIADYKKEPPLPSLQ